jgi:hypothetical protein
LIFSNIHFMPFTMLANKNYFLGIFTHLHGINGHTHSAHASSYLEPRIIFLVFSLIYVWKCNIQVHIQKTCFGNSEFPKQDSQNRYFVYEQNSTIYIIPPFIFT